MTKKVILRTSHWLCTDAIYGINGTDANAMPTLVDKIHATDIMIYYKDSDIPGRQWTNLIASVNFWVSKGKTVWIMIGKTTLTETAGTPYSVQYVIDTFKGKIAGIILEAFNNFNPTTATAWLLSKKAQLASNGMLCGYYHGDGFAQGSPATDVDVTYLANQGLIPIAWLRDDNSWKPATFNLPRFWVDYDILSQAGGGGPEGQSYAEIYTQWYLGNVIGKDNLKNNAGCEALVFLVYMNTSWPNADALKGMIAATKDWVREGITVETLRPTSDYSG